MSDLLAKLSAPFPPERISWRVGPTSQDKSKGIALAYIDARDVQDRLDAVCGIDGWECEHYAVGTKTACKIGIRVGETVLWRSDGAGDTDMEADKGAFSDSFKRAAVKWGVGRYLYDVQSPWVAIVARGKSYAIADNEFARLKGLLPVSNAPAAANAGDHQKSAPGVSKARAWVNETVRELNSAGDGDGFMEILASQKAYWVRICREYKNLWIGPDGSGLRGEALKVATIFQCRPAFDGWIADIELLANETTTMEAAQ